MKTKTVYYVDIVDISAQQSIMTIFSSENSDEAYDVAAKWNDGFDDPDNVYYTEAILHAEVYEMEMEIKEDKTMKKYTLKDYKDFSDEALVCPPFEEFESGTSDEEDWYDEHQIKIVVGDKEIELPYFADVINELDFALREMYEEEYGNGNPTTGNTVDSEYRPAELKDILRVAVQHGWEDYGYQRGDFVDFIREFVEAYDDVATIMDVYYDVIYKDIEWFNTIFKCNFGKLDTLSLRCIDRYHIKKVIEDLVCTDRELLVGYDNEHRCSDITFIMDHTFKPSGELVGWFYGEADDEYIGQLIADYKKKLFKEEN